MYPILRYMFDLFPTAILLGFNPWGWEWCQQNARSGKLEHCRNLAGTPLEPCWDVAGTSLLEPCWNVAGMSVECWWNLARALLEPRWKIAEIWNLAGTSLEPCCWNPWLEHLFGNRFSFYIVSCFAYCAGLWCWKSGLNFVGAVLQPCWNLYIIWRQLLHFLWVSFCFLIFCCGRQLKTMIPCWDCDAGILAWTFEGTLCWNPCRIALPCRISFQEALQEPFRKP